MSNKTTEKEYIKLMEDKHVQQIYIEKTGKKAFWNNNFTKGFRKFIETSDLMEEFRNNIESEEDKSEEDKSEEDKSEEDKSENIEEILEETTKSNNSKEELKNKELLENNLIQEIFKKKTNSNALKNGEFTKKFLFFVDKNDVKLQKYIESKLKKNIETKKDKKPIKKDKKPIVSAKEPENVKKLKIARSSTSKAIKPTFFNSSFQETWLPLIEEKIEELKEGIPIRIKGVIIIMAGETGSGKTWLGVDFFNVEEKNLGYRIIPQGRPLFILTTDPAPQDEVERRYGKHLWEVDKNKNPIGIFIYNCRVKNPETGMTDPIASLEKFNRFLSGLKELDVGTIIIEDWTLYCAFVLYSYMMKSGGKGSQGISFDEFMKPDKPISPTEHQYKARIIDEILLAFQNDFKMNFVLVANMKIKYKNTGDSIYKYEEDGKVPDMQKGSERKADIVGVMFKEEIDGKIYRKLRITKSRFEGEVVDTKETIITSPTADKLVDHIIKRYLQQKGK
ncbi:MAG: hypothetical protein ACFFG0_07845 [Candidatus Thorarchaeota archaeon]